MEGIRLQVQIMPWQDTEGSEVHGSSTKEEIAPFALRPVPPELLIAELAEQIVERFEKIHTGKGKLRIKYLRDGYKGIIEMDDCVGHHFVDRTKGNARKEDFTIHVYRYPPDGDELNHPHRFSSVAPDSSASWRALKRPISDRPEPALIRYTNGYFYQGPTQANKRQRLGYGVHETLNGPSGPVPSTEGDMTPAAGRDYNIASQDEHPDIMVVDSQRSPQRNQSNMAVLTGNTLKLAANHPRNETPKSESPELDVHSVPASNPSTPHVHRSLQQDEDAEIMEVSPQSLSTGNNRKERTSSGTPISKVLAALQSVPSNEGAIGLSTGSSSKPTGNNEEPLKSFSGSKAFKVPKSSNGVPNPADFDIETSPTQSGYHRNGGSKRKQSVSLIGTSKNPNSAPLNRIDALSNSKIMNIGRESNSAVELSEDSSSSDSEDSIPFVKGLSAKRGSATKQDPAKQGRAPRRPIPPVAQLQHSESNRPLRTHNLSSGAAKGNTREKSARRNGIANPLKHVQQSTSSLGQKSKVNASPSGVDENGLSQSLETPRRTARVHKKRVTLEEELSREPNTRPSPASTAPRRTSREQERKQAVAGEELGQSLPSDESLNGSLSLESASMVEEKVDENNQVAKTPSQSDAEMASVKKKRSRRGRGSGAKSGMMLGQDGKTMIEWTEDDGVSKNAQITQSKTKNAEEVAIDDKTSNVTLKEVSSQSTRSKGIDKKPQLPGTSTPGSQKTRIKLTPVFPGPTRSSLRAKRTRDSVGVTPSRSNNAIESSIETPALPLSPTIGRRSVSFVEEVIEAPKKGLTMTAAASDKPPHKNKSKNSEVKPAKSGASSVADRTKYRGETRRSSKQLSNGRSTSPDYDGDTIRVSSELPPLPSFKDILPVLPVPSRGASMELPSKPAELPPLPSFKNILPSPSREPSMEIPSKPDEKLELSRGEKGKTIADGFAETSGMTSPPVDQVQSFEKSMEADQFDGTNSVKLGGRLSTPLAVPSKSLSRSPAREVPTSSSPSSSSQTVSESESEGTSTEADNKVPENMNSSLKEAPAAQGVTISSKKAHTPGLTSESDHDSDVSIPLPKMPPNRSRSDSPVDDAERQLQREARQSTEPALSPQKRLPPKTPSKINAKLSSSTVKGEPRPANSRFPSLSGMMKATTPTTTPSITKDPRANLRAHTSLNRNPQGPAAASKNKSKSLPSQSSTESEYDDSEDDQESEDDDDDEEMTGSQSKAARSVKGLMKLAGKMKR